MTVRDKGRIVKKSNEPKKETTYFYDALENLVGSTPPAFMKTITVAGYYDLSDDLDSELQTWVVDNHPITWMTGIDVIEAAIGFVKGAIGNANIKGDV